MPSMAESRDDHPTLPWEGWSLSVTPLSETEGIEIAEWITENYLQVHAHPVDGHEFLTLHLHGPSVAALRDLLVANALNDIQTGLLDTFEEWLSHTQD
jgi:hypothetical protein